MFEKNISNLIEIFRKSALFILMLFITILIFTSTLFLFKISITIFHLPIAFLLTTILFFILCGHSKKEITSIILGVLFIVLAMYASSKYYDLSWDASTYHKEAVGILESGFNPIYDNYIEYYQKTNIRDTNIIGTSMKSKPGFWFTHYTKGIWVISANFYKVFSDIEAVKIFNLLITYITFWLSLSLFHKYTKSIIKALLISFFITVTPITIVQLFTYYNDGALYSALISLILVFVSFINPNKILTEKENYLWISCLIMISINIKFTCFAYAGIFCIALYLLYLYENYKDKTLKNIIKPTIIFATSVIIGIFLIGSSTYITNFMSNKNPLYPLIGKDKVDIISYNQPIYFAEKSTLYKLKHSLFSLSTNNKEEIHLKKPFTIYREEFTSLAQPDLRLSGYGVLFSGILIISLIICVIGLALSYKRNVFIFKITSIILLISTGFMLFFSESWWARYTPFLYFYPLIAIIYILFIFKQKYIDKVLFALFGIIMFLNVSYFFRYNTITNYKESIITRKVLNKVQKENKTITFVDEGYNFFGILYNLDDRGIKYEYVNEKKATDKRIFRFIRYRID